jgi:hypothetical protein
MALVRVSITKGVTTLPLIEISSQDLRKNGEHKKMMKDNSMIDVNQRVHLVGTG